MTCRRCEHIRRVLGLPLAERGLVPVVRRGMFKNGLTPTQKVMHVTFALFGVCIGGAIAWIGIRGTITVNQLLASVLDGWPQ